MEVRCSRCLKRSFCDEAKDWDFDHVGAVEVAPEIESCSDFDLDPAFYCDELAHAIMDVYPEEFKEVKVAEATGPDVPVFIIDIVIRSNLSPEDRRGIALEITSELNELNREQLHIQDAEFRVSISYVEQGGMTLREYQDKIEPLLNIHDENPDVDHDEVWNRLGPGPCPVGDEGVDGPTGPTEHGWHDEDTGGGTGVQDWPDVPDFLPEDL